MTNVEPHKITSINFEQALIKMEKQLIYRQGGQVKYWQYQLTDTQLRTYSGKNPDKLRCHEKIFATEQEAQDFAEKVERKKRQEGFVYLGNWEQAAFGEVVFQMTVPDRSVSNFFDVHPTEPVLALGTIKKDAYGACLYLVNFKTGQLEKVYNELPEVSGEGHFPQTFIHSMHFGPSGKEIFFTLNEQTHKLTLQTGETTRLAGYREWTDSQFNPFCVRPMPDQAHQRWLLFDTGNTAKVTDTAGNAVFQTRFLSTTAECRSGALSPSGKYVAFYIASRYLIYGHTDAAKDKTNEVQIWDVAQNTLVRTLPMDVKVTEVGFTPAEDQLVISKEFAQGPAFYDLRSGEKRFHFEDDFRDGRWFTCFSWAFSNGGQWLAVGGFSPYLFNAKTREPISLPYQPLFDLGQRVYGLAFSRDNRFLISGGDQGELFVCKMA